MLDEIPVDNRADRIGEFRIQQVYPNGLIAGRLKTPNDSFTQMTRAARDQSFHRCCLSNISLCGRLVNHLVGLFRSGLDAAPIGEWLQPVIKRFPEGDMPLPCGQYNFLVL